ncbi:MAG: IPT/TIG domain-containing protein [Bryobacterales bacterium]|nr:IPT/TIG domain-containing protein [Bryobacterales bacterium]
MANKIHRGSREVSTRTSDGTRGVGRSLRGARGLLRATWLLALLAAMNVAVWGQALAITELSRLTAVQGSGPVTLTVTGQGFESGAVVEFGLGNDLTPNPPTATATSLTVDVPNTLLQTPGPVTVTVRNPGGPPPPRSNGLQFTITAAPPTLISLNPPSAVVGNSATPLTVTGTNFVDGAVVLFGSTQLTVTFFSATELQTTIPVGELTTARTVTVTVRNPDTQTSGPQDFVVGNPLPVLISVAPNTAVAGSPDTPITLTGTGFNANSTVLANNAPVTITGTPTATTITATIPAAQLMTPGTLSIIVRNPAPGGGDSQPQTFTVTGPPPTLTRLLPAAGVASEILTRFEVDGANFLDTSQILFNGQPLPTTFVNAQTLRADNVPLPATPGIVKVRVRNPGPPQQLSEERDFEVLSLLSISLLAPNSAPEGSTAPRVVTITGTGFQTGATVTFGARAGLSTTVISSTQLTVTIPVEQLATRGVFQVSVQNPTGPPSNSLPFDVFERFLPQILNVSPPSVTVGSADTLLQIQTEAAGVAPGLRFGNDILPSTLEGTILRATIPAALLTTVRDVELRIRRPEDDETSLPVTFRVLALAPSISQVSPNTAVAGSSAVAITVTGGNFQSGAVVRFGAVNLTTTFDSASSLGAVIPTGLLNTLQTVQITVRNPDGQLSSGQPFTVEAAPPTLTSLSPSSAVQNGSGFTVTVTGSSFQSGAVVRFGTVDLATTFVNANSLTANLPAAQLTEARTVSVSVRNPDGKLSGSQSFTVTAQADSPTITSLAPDRLPAGSPASVLTLTGTNFVSGSRVLFRGTQLTPSATTSTSITVTVPATLLELADIVQVRVLNPSGASSNVVEFTVQAAGGAPILTQLTPANAPVSTVNLVLTVTGSNIAPGAVLLFGSTILNPTSLAPTSVVVPIPPALLTTARIVPVTIRNPGGQVSNALEFTVGDPTPPPPPGLEISVQSLPTGVVGEAYGPTGTGVTITATGGTAPYTLDVATETVGALLAVGLQVERPNATTPANPVTLRILGTPTSAGQVPVRVIARDGAGAQVTRDLQLLIFPSALRIAPDTLPSAVIGVPYQQQLSLTGLSTQEQTPPQGQPVVTWTLLNAPAGLTITSGGMLQGTFPAAAQLSFQVRATTSLRQATRAYTLMVDVVRPTISTTSLPNAIVGTPYTGEIQATGGTPGYTWQIAGIVLPAGLSFDAPSVTSNTLRIIGTPLPTAESRTFTLSVRDSLNRTDSREFALNVTAVPIPALSFAPIPNPAPREQRDVVLTLAQAYPLPLNGVATITFTPNATNNADDPNVRFVVGTDAGRSATFQIAANSTAVVFPNASPQRIQTGTVAGAIRVRAQITGGPTQDQEIVIPRSAPQVLDLALTRNGDNFTVSLTGFSTPRDLTSALFTFTAPSGSGLQTSQVTIPLSEAATTWYNSNPGRTNGSAFRLTVPFTVQGGANPVQSVSVTLTNSVGSSPARTANF